MKDFIDRSIERTGSAIVCCCLSLKTSDAIIKNECTFLVDDYKK